MRAPADLRCPRGISEIRVNLIREPIALYHADAGPEPVCDTPAVAVGAFNSIALAVPEWTWDRETAVALFLSTRRRILGWEIISQGLLDTLLLHPRDVFRSAIVCNAHALILAHSHPSGDPMPSEADVRVTRDLIRAGQLIRIELIDHVVVGAPDLRRPGCRGWSSLKELGYFLI
jgi:hypothetical protein